jgi:septum formation protein
MAGKISKIFKRDYVLASKSPRRSILLNQLGLNFISIDSDIIEKEGSNLKPLDVVKYNSLHKSRKVALDYRDKIVIGADTVVVLDKEMIGKPKSVNEAIKFLKKLSGKMHYVYTGFNVIDTRSGKERFDYERTSVYFRELSNEEITYYVKNFTPMDKAGAYGIQDDFGCLFIEKINGDYYNVVGLPLKKLYLNLKEIL